MPICPERCPECGGRAILIGWPSRKPTGTEALTCWWYCDECPAGPAARERPDWWDVYLRERYG